MRNNPTSDEHPYWFCTSCETSGAAKSSEHNTPRVTVKQTTNITTCSLHHYFQTYIKNTFSENKLQCGVMVYNCPARKQKATLRHCLHGTFNMHPPETKYILFLVRILLANLCTCARCQVRACY